MGNIPSDIVETTSRAWAWTWDDGDTVVAVPGPRILGTPQEEEAALSQKSWLSAFFSNSSNSRGEQEYSSYLDVNVEAFKNDFDKGRSYTKNARSGVLFWNWFGFIVTMIIFITLAIEASQNDGGTGRVTFDGLKRVPTIPEHHLSVHVEEHTPLRIFWFCIFAVVAYWFLHFIVLLQLINGNFPILTWFFGRDSEEGKAVNSSFDSYFEVNVLEGHNSLRRVVEAFSFAVLTFVVGMAVGISNIIVMVSLPVIIFIGKYYHGGMDYSRLERKQETGWRMIVSHTIFVDIVGTLSYLYVMGILSVYYGYAARDFEAYVHVAYSFYVSALLLDWIHYMFTRYNTLFFWDYVFFDTFVMVFNDAAIVIIAAVVFFETRNEGHLYGMVDCVVPP